MKVARIALLLALALSVIAPFPSGKVMENGYGMEYKEFSPQMNISDAASASFIGNGTGQMFGQEVSPNCGDLNGDGFDDLLVGVPDGYSRGKTMVVFGGSSLVERVSNQTVADIVIDGETEGSKFGSSVNYLGDVNDDGFEDFGVIANSYYGDGNRGRFYLFLGKGEWQHFLTGSDADMILSGDSTEVFWGHSLSGTGDINGDSFDDFIVCDALSASGSYPYSGKGYVIYGRSAGWPACMSIADFADVTISGGFSYAYCGYTIGGLGDVNGDSMPDFALSSYFGSSYKGMIGIFFGKGSDWPSDLILADADVVIDGENPYDYLGNTVSGCGDLNNDGLNDLVAGATGNDEGGISAGKVYVFFGRRSWPSSLTAASADINVAGTVPTNSLGQSDMIVPDMNNDGIADLLIGAPNYDFEGKTLCGIVFLYHGGQDLSGKLELDEADASFIGEGPYEDLGYALSIAGDLIGTGSNFVSMVSPWSPEGGLSAGKLYVLGGGRSQDPVRIMSLSLYSDQDYTQSISVLDIGETAFIELRGTDGNASTRDMTYVNLTLNLSHPTPIRVPLLETGYSTGIYRGKFRVSGCRYGEMLSARSIKDPTKIAELVVDTPVRLPEIASKYALKEGERLEIDVHNLGYCSDPVWSFNADAGWLGFDRSALLLTGTPENGDVGNLKANVSISGGEKSSVVSFSVKVTNVPPKITSSDIQTALEDSPYEVDYACDEDGEDGIAWKLSTDLVWLRIDRSTGVLSGTPGDEDLGTHRVEVAIDDGNSGTDRHGFNLTVINANDRPVIETEDVTTVDQGIRYLRTYSAMDPDPSEVLTWTLSGPAWLSLDVSTISGTPGPFDIGEFIVNVTVKDRSGASDSHEFTLEVKNVNDAPIFVEIPQDSEISCGSLFAFHVNSSDPDGDPVAYSVKTVPLSDMTIDKNGNIRWDATDRIFKEEGHSLFVEVTASDGKLKTTSSFRIKVVMTLPPTSILSVPADQSRVRSSGSSLEWTGSDPEGASLTYDVYLSPDMASILSMKDEARYVKSYPGTKLPLTSLEPGKRYYWTAIPFDGGRYGTCTTGMRSFVVNNPPTVIVPDIPDCLVGSEFKLKLTGKDLDPSDGSALKYVLVDGPDGMTVGSSTGFIRWTPKGDQAMLFSVMVNVTDGIEDGSCTFVLEVQPQEKASGGTLGLIIGGIVALLVVILIGVAIFVIRKRSKIDDEPAESVIGIPNEIAPPKIECAVSTSIGEAHASDQIVHAPKTYEDLYGTKPPVKEEGMTPSELRDYIKAEIKNLEEM